MAQGQLKLTPQVGWMKYCILITPSPVNNEWVSRIGAALKDQSRSLHVVNTTLSGPLEEDREESVYLAFHADGLCPAPDAVRGLVLASAATSVHVMGVPGEEAIRRVSIVYAGHALWRSDTIVSEVDLERADEAGVEILPGLRVLPPDFSAWISDPLTVRAALALAPYWNGPPSPGAQADWTNGVLIDKSRRDGPRPLSGPIDLTGRPRQLITGPYYCLPPGIWRVNIKFQLFVENTADFRFEWGEPGHAVALTSSEVRTGRYSVSLEQRWDREGAAEIVVEIFSAMLMGSLVIDEVLIEKIE